MRDINGKKPRIAPELVSVSRNPGMMMDSVLKIHPTRREIIFSTNEKKFLRAFRSVESSGEGFLFIVAKNIILRHENQWENVDFSKIFFRFKPFNLLNDWKVGRMEKKCVKSSPRSSRSNGFDTPSATQPGKEGINKRGYMETKVFPKTRFLILFLINSHC